MNWKRGFAAICVAVVACSVPVFAQEQTIQNIQTTPQQAYTEKKIDIRNGTLTFIVRNEEHKKDCRCYPTTDIVIKEDKAGILKDGDIIYFETSRQGDIYCINEYLEIETKGLSVEEIEKTPQQKQNEFAIRISRKNTTEPAEIKLHSDVYIDGQYDIGATFSLQLSTDRTKQNNLFSGIAEQNIVLNEQFVKIIPYAISTEPDFPMLLFTTNKNTVTWNGVEEQLKHNIFINEKGTAMISFEDYTKITEKLYGTEKEQWKEDSMKKHNILLNYIEQDSTGKNSLQNTSLFQTVLDKKDDVYYVSLRTVALIWGREDNIVWDNITKTITIK